MEKYLVKRPKLGSTNNEVKNDNKSVAHDACSSNDKNYSVISSATGKAVSGITKGRQFQVSWKAKHPWITFNDETKNVLCSICKQCSDLNLLRCTKKDKAFISEGFFNWKHALEKFRTHERSECHHEAMEKSKALEKEVNVLRKLSSAKANEMITARDALHVIFTSLLYLARQGLAIRGHDDSESNLLQLLNVRSKESTPLLKWIDRKEKYKWLSPAIQNEILEMMANQVLRSVVREVKTSIYFGLIVDETTDGSNQEQVSICLRYVDVDENVEVQEDFVGFYVTESTSAETLFRIIEDVLRRFGLSFENCRGQCYDGANTFSGAHNGVQERIKKQQPCALFVHCSAHRLNLMVQDTVQQVAIVRDAMNTIKDLINFIKESPSRLARFRSFQELDSGELRPLCPTRWLMRVSSIKSVLNNYAALLDFLEEYAIDQKSKPAFASKCSGFLKVLLQFDFFFGLKLIFKFLGPIEEACRGLQSPDISLRTVEEYIEIICLLLVKNRSQEEFYNFWEDVKNDAKSLDIEMPKLPRIRKKPKKIDNGQHEHKFSTPEDLFRKNYYEVIDFLLNAIGKRFSKCCGFSKLKLIEEEVIGFLNSNKRDLNLNTSFENFCDKDIDLERLLLHMSMHRDIVKKKNENIKNMSLLKSYFHSNATIAGMLSEIVKLIKIFYVVPATSCTAERSFSCLRRLKNFLRSTIGQKRLNHCAILNSHKEYVDSLNIDLLVNEFIKRNRIRLETFASF